jgi:hypothetical protein
MATSSSTGADPDACLAYCEHVGPECPSFDASECQTACEEVALGACNAEWSAVIACLTASNAVACDETSISAPECEPAIDTYLDCATAACFHGSGSCNPLTDSCGVDEACTIDEGTLQFECRPAPSAPSKNMDCDEFDPAPCAHGHYCFDGRCEAFCCSDDDCPGGFEECEAMTLVDGNKSIDIGFCF